MKARNLLIATATLFLFAAGAFAALSPDRAEFGKGPASYFMTKEELAQWKSLQTDADADAFIAQFWAKRTPGFKQDFQERVAAADKSFSFGRIKGSTTDRGKVFMLFGTPTRMTKSGGRNTTAPQSREQMLGTEVDDQGATQTWIYEGTEAKAFGGRAEVVFFDRFNSGDFRMQTARFDFNAAQQRVIASAMAPAGAPAAAKAPQAPPPAAAAPAAPADALKTQALKDAIAAAKAGSSNLKKGNLVYAEFVAPSGDFYVPLGVIVPKGDGVSADAYDTIFGQVEDANGAVVAAFEQPATPTAFKNGVFADRALNLPTGRYTAVMGLAKAGAPVVVATKPLDVTSIGKDAAGTSKLFVTNDLVELGEPMPEKTGFAFGKTKVIPTAQFGRNDQLIFFVEVHNPGIDPATNMPKLQASLDFIGGKFKKPISRPMTEQPVAALSGKPGPGQYAIIDSIPLDQIQNVEPGDYTLKMKIVDTVTKTSYTLEQSFKITG